MRPPFRLLMQAGKAAFRSASTTEWAPPVGGRLVLPLAVCEAQTQWGARLDDNDHGAVGRTPWESGRKSSAKCLFLDSLALFSRHRQ